MDSERFEGVQDSIFTSLIATIKTARSLSLGDIPFNRSLDTNFRNVLDSTNARLLTLVNLLLHNAAEGVKGVAPKLTEADSVDAHWTSVTEIVDLLLEKADSCIDESTGSIKRNLPQDEAYGPSVAWNRRRNYPSTRPGSVTMTKPQLSFHRPLDPMSHGPFKPLLRSKPNSGISLQESLKPIIENGRKRFPHPYSHEIKTFRYPDSLSVPSQPTQFINPAQTHAIWVDTKETLVEMLESLKSCSEIAVDLEHHDFRSYIGIVCLMQISSRKQDWIIDALKLREELQILNEVFTSPKIIKVFHGAFMDIIWLQRDLGIYVVGLFDTYDASKSLCLLGHSLAFLLKKYVNFDADKKYQLADWRQRPLPKEMLEYARSDTHFLLFIFDMMKNELLKSSDEGTTNLLDEVLKNSRETSLKTYDFEAYDKETGSGINGWATFLKRNPILFTPQQFTVFKYLHEWRDKVARREDESLHYVLPKHHLINLARQMPQDTAGLLAACHPATPPVRTRASELCAVIAAAKESAQSLAGSYLPLSIKGGSMEPDNNADELPKGINKRPISATNVNVFSLTGIERVQESTFWGASFGGSLWGGSVELELPWSIQDLSLAIPLPKLEQPKYRSSSRRADSGQEGHQLTGMPKKKRRHSGISEHLLDSSRFGVDTERKRKGYEMESPVSSMAQNVEDLQKRQRTADSILQRQALGETQRAVLSTGSFDYMSASAVLHASRESRMEAHCDNYTPSKADQQDNIKEAKGRTKEKDGKTFTFRS